MLGVLLLLALIWGVLLAVLWAGSLVAQGLFYSEPEPTLYWRAPAAATAITAVFGLWTLLAYNNPEAYQPWWLITNTKTTEVSQLQALTRDHPKTWTDYTPRRNARGVTEYWVDSSGQHLPTPPEAVRIRQDGDYVEFRPERDPETKAFKRDENRKVVYHDDQGRIMTEDRLGAVTESHSGVLWANWLMMVLFFVAWFLCLWLLLAYTWGHALILAAVLWVATIMFVQPFIHGRVTAMRQQQTTATTACSFHRMCMISPSWTM